MLVRRDTREKAFVPLAGLAARGERAAASDAGATCSSARAHVRGRQHGACPGYDEFKQVMAERRGFLVARLVRRRRPARPRIKQETKATVRVIPLEGDATPAACVRCGAAVTARGVFRPGVLTAAPL